MVIYDDEKILVEPYSYREAYILGFKKKTWCLYSYFRQKFRLLKILSQNN